METTDKSDLDTFEAAVRLFIQTMKRPQSWAMITQKAEVDIDRPAAAILLILTSLEPKQLNLSDLVSQLGIEAPSVSRKVAQLEQAGLLVRQQNPIDRRVFGIQVTHAGHTIVKRIRDCQREITDHVLQAWQISERQQFIQLFERFSQDMAHQYKTAHKQPEKV